MRRLSFVTASAVLMLAGCSSSSESGGADLDTFPDPETTTSSTPSAPPDPTDPTCATVWRAGQTLPDDYTSCRADGETAPQDVVDCLDGTSLIVFDDRFWAVTGQVVVEPADAPLQDTDEYGAAFVTCTGE